MLAVEENVQLRSSQYALIIDLTDLALPGQPIVHIMCNTAFMHWKNMIAHHNPITPVIQNLGLMNQYLIHRSIDFGLLHEAKQLQHLDMHLSWLLHKASSFDFVTEIAGGKTLLVGEGNLSFALSLAEIPKIFPSQLVATTFEAKSNLSREAAANAKGLQSLGVTVLHGVNATKLAAALGSWKFDNIVFQFPHVGSREPVEGRNPNFILVRDFLKSAARQLQPSGKVLISAVDSPHYHGAFQFDEAAEAAGFKTPASYPFELSVFSGYEHTMTNEDESAIDHHRKFRTWVFRR